MQLPLIVVGFLQFACNVVRNAFAKLSQPMLAQVLVAQALDRIESSQIVAPTTLALFGELILLAEHRLHLINESTVALTGNSGSQRLAWTFSLPIASLSLSPLAMQQHEWVP